jgi:hypothetical protein
VSGILGATFDQAAFRRAYTELNVPAYHPFTADNQDYLAYVCLMFAASYAFFMSLFVTNPEIVRKMNNQWAMLRMMSSISPFDKPFLMFLDIFSIVCAVPLGMAGLVLLERFRREERVRQPVPAPDQAVRGRTEE